MAEAKFRLPELLDLSDGNVSENFRKWRRNLEIYMKASGSTSKCKATQVAIILHCAGPKTIEVYDQFEWELETDKNDPEIVLRKLEEYCNPRSNEVIESHRFWCLPWQEPFDLFLTELRNRADRCQFGDQKDRLIRDKIIFSAQGKLQEHLLRQDATSLEKTIKICRTYEQSQIHLKEIRDVTNFNNQPSPVSVNKVRIKPEAQRGLSRPNHPPSQAGRERDKWKKDKLPECNFCGKRHVLSKYKCPAWGKICDLCKGRNHFRQKCKKSGKVHYVEQEDQDECDEKWLAAVKKGPNENVTAIMEVNNLKVRFQLDSAADINTISQKYVRKDQVRSTNIKLKMWNKTDLKPLGEVSLPLINPRTGETCDVNFVVVPNDLMCLLGLKTIQKMGLVTINNNMFIHAVSAMSLGDIGQASLEVDQEVKPVTLPCRKIPIAIQDSVKQELDILVDRGVLVPVTKPTEWVSQMAIAHKANGKLRICIDPQPLNTALKREHYKLPTLDDILPKLSEAKVFSKLDVREAYWHVRLDEKSSELTTMITPFGRFRWARLPFGLKVSSEIFQRKITEAIGDLDGVFTIADDIIVVGRGETESDAKLDNDKKLDVLYSRCKERSIVLNDEKKEVGLHEISFHGHKITKDGIKADDAKIEAILNMPQPTDVTGVKRLCGVIQYLAKFLPDLSNTLEPIRNLVRKDTPFNWSQECETAFQQLKHKVTEAPVLAYFDPHKELVVQVDSSKDGLGACLMQDGRPIEFASRTLKPSERNWAQIEKETLSILFGLERFDQYIYGRKVIVQNDHKPLQVILNKPLSRAPKRLQDLMMKLNRYDFDFEFIKGKQLLIADTLSRAFLSDDNEEEEARPRIMNVSTTIPDARIQEVRKATEDDPEMQTLMKLIKEGWPEHKNKLPLSARPYFDFRHELSHDDGIVTKAEAILIPKALRFDMKQRLHSAHLGYDSMMRRARGVIFWPQVSKDIKQIVDYCEPCQEMKPRNHKETLKQHDDGGFTWNKIGMDLFEIEGRNYLVTVDYYSNFIEVDLMTTTTSTQVTACLKRHIARYGFPATIVSDGGPQFTASQFREFTDEWRIDHIMSSPGHQQANGKAESAVKTVKHMMMKARKSGTDQTKALLELRNTPQQSTGLSPTELMFGRKTKTLIPSLEKPKNIVHKSDKRNKCVKKWFDNRARDLKKLRTGQSVYFEHKQNQKWILGTVVRVIGDRTYIIETNEGTRYRRNRIHMRPTKISTSVMSRRNEKLQDLNKCTDEMTKSRRQRREPKYLQDYVRY